VVKEPTAQTASAAYSVEVDQVNEQEWSELLTQFDDASIYQTWAYGAVCWARSQLSHFVLKRGDKIVAAAQLRLVRVPVVRTGIAYVRWAPLWRRRGEPVDVGIFKCALEALKEEYARRRGLLLRIVPNVYDNDLFAGQVTDALEAEQFHPSSAVRPYTTGRVDLSLPLETVRKQLHQRWRNKLSGAEKSGYTVVAGNDAASYERFLRAYRQMMARKQFDTTVDVDEFLLLQQRLPESMRMQVLICELDNRLLNALVVSAIGDTGIYLLAATSDEGLNGKGAFLLQWRMMEYLRERDVRWYDLGGLNAERNPGVYQFKHGMGGQEVRQLPRYDYSANRLGAWTVALGERAVHTLARGKAILRRRSHG
jgi:hypothetical protein